MELHCRRCGDVRLIRLAKRLDKDNEVYRCRGCGFIFSPSDSSPTHAPALGA